VVAFLQQIEFVCAVIPDELRTGLGCGEIEGIRRSRPFSPMYNGDLTTVSA